MNFFERQDAARRRTTRLVVLFLLAAQASHLFFGAASESGTRPPQPARAAAEAATGEGIGTMRARRRQAVPDRCRTAARDLFHAGFAATAFFGGDALRGVT